MLSIPVRLFAISTVLVALCPPANAQAIAETRFNLPLEMIIAADNRRAEIKVHGAYRISDRARFAAAFGNAAKAKRFLQSIVAAEARSVLSTMPYTVVLQPAKWTTRLRSEVNEYCTNRFRGEGCPFELTRFQARAYPLGKAPSDPPPPPLKLSDNLWELNTKIRALTKQGNRQEARRHAAHALKIAARNKVVPRYLEYFRALLAGQLDIDNEHIDAEKLHKKAWNTASEFSPSGNEGEVLAIILSGYADNQYALKKWKNAEGLYRRLLEVYEKRYGQDNLFTASTVERLSDIYRFLNQKEKALEADLRRVAIAKAMKRQHGMSSFSVNFMIIYRLAESLDKNGKTGKAADAYGRLIAMLSGLRDGTAYATYGGKHYTMTRGHALSIKGKFHLRKKNYRLAEASLKKALAAFRTAPSNHKVALRETADMLETIYRAENRIADIENMRKIIPK